MRKSTQAILFLKAFTLGVCAPVLVLILITHGATMETSSLFKGIASFVIIAAEFPSGVFADLFGRKLSFIVSSLLRVIGFALLFVSQSALLLAAALACYGLSRAFASGSIEALAIDEIEDKNQLTRVTTRLNILEGTGLATGTLLGGVLAGIGDTYAANILFVIAGSAVILLLTVFTVKESEHIKSRVRAQRPRLKDHLRGTFSFAFQSRIIRMLLILCFLTGFAMVTVETYWQPTISAFTPETWVLGIVGFIGFAGVIVGSKLAEFVLTRYARGGITVFLISKALLSLCLALFMAARYQVPFILVYLFWYVFLGGNGVAEQTLVNRETLPAQRASVLSLFSLGMQLGGLLSAGACYLIIIVTDYRYTWLVAALILAAATLVYSLASLRQRRGTPSQQELPDRRTARKKRIA